MDFNFELNFKTFWSWFSKKIFGGVEDFVTGLHSQASGLLEGAQALGLKGSGVEQLNGGLTSALATAKGMISSTEHAAADLAAKAAANGAFPATLVAGGETPTNTNGQSLPAKPAAPATPAKA